MIRAFFGRGPHRRRLVWLAAPLGLAVAFVAHSLTVTGGDPQQGAALVASCSGCHGPNGNSQMPVFPSLAGQHEQYLVKQLASFANGERQDPMMTGVVAGLRAEDFPHIAAYFARQTPPARVAGSGDLVMGEQIYRGGNAVTGVTACAACHAPNGVGNPLTGMPRLAGQQQDYLVKTLQEYASGVRRSDTSHQGMMRDIARRMSEAEIRAVAAYIQGLR